MDSETGKAIISAISAIVAVVSAALAYRARFQTRTDLFETQRDALVLIMAENDNRCSYIKLQTAFVKTELERVLAHVQLTNVREEANRYIKNLAEIEQLSKRLELREYTPQQLDSLEYSEGALAVLRRVSRGEQVNLKHLNAADYDLVFEHIRSFIKRHDKAT